MMLTDFKDWLRSRVPGTVEIIRKLKAKKWPEKSIVYYLEKYPMVLESDLRKKGASGSDAAVVFLSQEWVKLGYEVTVYTNCKDKEGVYNGVKYVNYYRLNWYDTFDTLIIWRHPRNLRPGTKAKRIWLDWHDVAYPPHAFTPDYLQPFDKIFAKSHYQRRLLPEFPDDKFVIIPNGVDPGIIEFSDRPKNPYKLVYSSRYYRGLEFMLTYGWPIIKREIPEAELNLYYGWTKRDEYPKRAEWKQKMIELMTQPGVIDRGRVGQETLIEEKSTSAIHYYGCTYEEIDCISIRESAMVGCVPVTTDFAALSEKDYSVKVPGNPSDRVTQEALAYQIVNLLKNPDELEKIRQKFKELVKKQTWENFAKLWLEKMS